MDTVQDCDSYINMPSSQTYRSALKRLLPNMSGGQDISARSENLI
jgi:hypothetical protein